MKEKKKTPGEQYAESRERAEKVLKALEWIVPIVVSVITSVLVSLWAIYR